jgi:uncharacterized repeat protein (TIGR03803 family)
MGAGCYSTWEGGDNQGSTVFSLKPDTGKEKVLYSFPESTYGAYPTSLINIGQYLYGTASYGGTYDVGAVFSPDPGTGTEAVLYSFCPGYPRRTDGEHPSVGGLIELNGRLYGATCFGGRGRRESGVIYWVKIP